jgi:hypothetical protein
VDGDGDGGYSSDEWWDESGTKRLLNKLTRKKGKKDSKSDKAKAKSKVKDDPRFPMIGYCDITVVRGEKMTNDSISGLLYLTLNMSFPETAATYQTDAKPYITASEGDEQESVEWNDLLSCVLVHQNKEANASFARYPKLVVRLKQKSALRDKVVGKGEIALEHVIQPNKKGEAHSKDSELVVPLLSNSGTRQGNVFLKIKFVQGKKGIRPEQ